MPNNMAGKPRGSWEPLTSIIVVVVLVVILAIASPVIWSALIEVSNAVR